MAANTTHPSFTLQPDNENAKIWRYMDFAKYVSLLSKQELFFARSDMFEDPFEGSIPAKISELWRSPLPETHRHIHHDITKHQREWTYISCWHLNEYESEAMWKLYAKTNEAVAIQSTYAKLRDSLPNEVCLGCVNYMDYETLYSRTPIKSSPDQIWPFIHKRISFEHEKEVRAVKWRLEDGFTYDKDGWTAIGAKKNTLSGQAIPLPLKEVIEKIYIAPYAPNWFKSVVESVTEKYSFEFSIVQSDMNNQPSY